MEQDNTGNNSAKSLNPPYLLSYLYELNILADSMENRHGLRYTTHFINCHIHLNGFGALCKSTFNLAFLRLRPNITRIQKIQQGDNNEGKWKEVRQCQTKKWLIMLNRLPEDK